MKKSTKTIVAVVTVAIAVLGLLALAGVFMNRANKISYSEFFEKAGIVTDVNGNKSFNDEQKDQLEIVSIRSESFTIKGYDKNGRLKYVANIDRNVNVQPELNILIGNGVVIECADPNAGSFWSMKESCR